jgi:hypothetical protein
LIKSTIWTIDLDDTGLSDSRDFKEKGEKRQKILVAVVGV